MSTSDPARPADQTATSSSPAGGLEERSTTAGVPHGDIVVPGGHEPAVDPITDAVVADDWGRIPADDLDVDEPTLHPLEGEV